MSLTPEEARQFAREVFDDDASSVTDTLGQCAEATGDWRPSRIGPYRVVRRLGEGGWGVVFEGEQEHPRRRVAIKVLRSAIVSSKARIRFDIEQQLLAQLQHPGIAEIYASGIHQEGSLELPYFAMQLVEGGLSIRSFVVNNALSTRQVLDLFARVCDAVDCGHRNGIVHRDLKPSNILVQSLVRDGADIATDSTVSTAQPIMIDFGVARVVGSMIDAPELTMPGVTVGTIAYMSPEQCRGANVDVRSDVCSLGVVFFELLAGRLPFEFPGTDAEDARRVIQHQQAPRLRTLVSGLHPNIEAIVACAMSKNPDHRYRSAGAMADDIRRHLAGQPVSARAPNRWTRCMYWFARHPRWSLVGMPILLSIMAACLALGITTWTLRSTPISIQYSDPSNTAQLLAANGRLIREWSPPGETQITFAQSTRARIRGRDRFGIVLGYNESLGDDDTGALVVYSASVWGVRREWSDRLETSELPPAWAEAPGLMNVRHNSVIGDFLGPTDDPEILVIFGHEERGFTGIRIYSFDGDLLLQKFHNGAITEVRWNPEQSQLVVLAYCHDISWDDFGPDAQPAVVDPRVIFALTMDEPLIRKRPMKIRGPGRDPEIAWYKCVDSAAVDHIGDWEFTRSATNDPRGTVRVYLIHPTVADATLTIVVDGQGNIVATPPNVQWDLAVDPAVQDHMGLLELPAKHASGDVDGAVPSANH